MKYYKFLEKKITGYFIVYVILFSVIAYIICVFSVSKDYAHSASTAIGYVTNDVSEALTYSTNITGFLQEFPSVSDFITSKDQAEMAKNAVNAIETLRAISFSASDLLSGIAIANLDTDTVLTDSGSFKLDFFAQRFGLSAAELRASLSAFVNDENIRPWTKTSTVSEINQQKYYLTMILCPGVGKHTMPVIYLFDLDRFLDHSSADPSHSAIVLKLNGQTVRIRSGYKANHIEDEMENRLKFRTVATDNASTFWYDIETSYVTRNLDYLLATNNFFILFMFILLVALFVTLYISKKNAQRIYVPISTVMRRLAVGQDEGKDEFESIESSISSLFNENKALSSMIQDYKISLLDQFWINLINGTLSSKEISDGIRNYNLEEVGFPLTVCILECKNYAELTHFLDTDALCGIHTSAGYFIEQEFSGRGFFKVLDLDLKSHILIMPFSGYAETRQLLLSLALKIESGMDLVLKVSFGPPANNFYALSRSFSAAISLQRNMIVSSGFTMVLSPNDLPSKDFSASGYSPEAESTVINQILSCDLDNAYSGMTAMINSVMGDGVFTKDQHSQLVVMLFVTFSRSLSAINKTEKQLFGEDISIYLELKQCTTQSLMNEKVYELLKEIISYIKTSRLSADEQTKQKMLDYIHQNYQKNISLLTLASSMNMSQFYVSKQFKQLVGENFKDYLAKYRMEKAIFLFRENPNMKIKDVAEDVGYNTETFSRTFTKYYGMLPSKYIERFKKEQ